MRKTAQTAYLYNLFRPLFKSVLPRSVEAAGKPAAKAISEKATEAAPKTIVEYLYSTEKTPIENLALEHDKFKMLSGAGVLGTLLATNAVALGAMASAAWRRKNLAQTPPLPGSPGVGAGLGAGVRAGLGAGIGAGLGAGVGAMTGMHSRKNAIRNALIGVALGGALGYGVGRLT